MRQAVSQELRLFLTGGQADRGKLLALGRRYGELDGELSFLYATAFTRVNGTLSAAQRAALVRLRNLDGYTSAPTYIYSDPPLLQPGHPRCHLRPPRAGCGDAARHRSPAVGDDGALPVEFTGDGEGVTPPLEWYWTVYNIPADARGLASDARGVGVTGNNSVDGKVGYAPPHSKGPGAKTYTLTLYALSQPLEIAREPQETSREVLLQAMQGRVLGSAELQVTYTRGTEG